LKSIILNRSALRGSSIKDNILHDLRSKHGTQSIISKRENEEINNSKIERMSNMNNSLLRVR
jgi:hypothetical protein